MKSPSTSQQLKVHKLQSNTYYTFFITHMIYVEGQRLTIFEISSMMAMTHKREIQICGELNDRVTFRIHGQRKMFYLPKFNESALIFDGWDIPIKYDGEITRQGAHFQTSTIRGNACLNLVGDMQLIREWVQSKNLNENFTRFDVVIHIDGAKETPVFPEVPTSHAVVERIRLAQ